MLFVKVFGPRDYVVYEQERISYEEAHRRVAVIANMLQKEFGIKKGDRVAIAMRNLPEWLLTFWVGAAAFEAEMS